jgi:hypothetical protein
MTDEEREALEILKGFEPDDLVECAIYLQALERITNLIEKQSKEIERINEILIWKQRHEEQLQKEIEELTHIIDIFQEKINIKLKGNEKK